MMVSLLRLKVLPPEGAIHSWNMPYKTHEINTDLMFSMCLFLHQKRTFTTWILRFMFNMWYVDLWGVWPNPSLCLVHFFRDSARRSKKDKKNKAVKANGSGAKVRKAAWHPSGCGSHFWWAYWVQLLCVPQIPITGDQKCHAFCECNTAIRCFCQLGPKRLCVRVYIFWPSCEQRSRLISFH